MPQGFCNDAGWVDVARVLRVAHTPRMLKTALRFFLLRFLPRRLVPILTVIELVRLVRRLRGRGPVPVAPRRLRTVGDGTVGDGTVAPPTTPPGS